jgi:hypothetical protein
MAMQIDTHPPDPVDDRRAILGSVIGVALLFAGLVIAKLFFG